MIRLFMTHPCLPAGRPYSPLKMGVIGNHFISFIKFLVFINFNKIKKQ